MALMALLTVLAAGMVAVYTSSLNHVQAFSNGELAQAEAESAINELIARLNEDPTFGDNGEEIRGTRTRGMSEEQAYHILTFDNSSSYPHSVNARGGSGSGSMGRSIPNGHVHAVATGYCRGQYRTVEVLLEHPPFPYGLASSGQINSVTPLEVRGTSGAWSPGDEDRPGHLVSNSPGGVTIGSSSGASTFISGMVKSRGAINIGQPATVLEGLFPHSSTVQLPNINLASFNNYGDDGVIEILDREFPAQILDAMYYSHHTITYNGPVSMNNSFMYCEEDINIYGGLSGVGAIVARGNVTINGGSQFSGTNNVAVLAGGRITLRGAGNYFRGIVYGEGGIDAQNVTVVGNAIANNASRPEAASVRLDDVIFISSDETSTLNFTARSRRAAVRQRQGGRIPFQITLEGDTFPRGDRNGGRELIGETDSNQSLDELRSNVSGLLRSLWPASGPSEVVWNGAYDPGTQGGQVRRIGELFRTAFGHLEAGQVLQEELDLLIDAPSTPDDDQTAADRRAEIRSEMATLRGRFQSAIAEAESEYIRYVEETANSNGSYLEGFAEPDVFRDYSIDLNTYLPQSEQYRIAYYNVFGRRF